MINKKVFGNVFILGIFLMNIFLPIQNILTSITDENGKEEQNLDINIKSSTYSANTQINNEISFQNQNNPKSILSSEQENSKVESTNPFNINSSIKKNSFTTIYQNLNDSLWYNFDWKYRKNITVIGSAFSSPSGVVDFPLQLDFYDTDLKLASGNGYDILFTDTLNNKLSYERITFNKFYNSTHTHLIVWVKGTFPKSSNTVLMMYFGNPFATDQQNSSATWSNGFEAVYHLNSISSSTVVDSTSKYNGTTTMTSSSIQPGVIGNGLLFDGSSKINLGNINSNNWAGLTIEAWIFRTITTTSFIVSKEDSSSVIWSIESATPNTFRSSFRPDGASLSPLQQPNGLPSVSNWGYLSFAWSPNASVNQLFLYLNSSLIKSGAIIGSSVYDSSGNSTIGSAYDGTFGFIGIIDEVRISSVNRSQNWLNDTMNNQLHPNNFYIVDSNINKFQLEGSPIPWAINQLNYRKNVTILSSFIPQNFTNFPYLLTMTDSDLKTYAQSSGTDIIFTDLNGQILEQETEKYTYSFNSTHSKMSVWLNIPFLSNLSDITIYMYYGNATVTKNEKPSGVFTNYTGVWHLSDTGNFLYDSSIKGYTGNTNGNLPALDTQIGNGQEFNGLNSYFYLSSSNLINSDDVFITGWFKLKNEFTSTSLKSQYLLGKYLDLNNNSFVVLAGDDFKNTGVPRGSLVFKTEQSNSSVYTYTNKTSWLANTWYQFSIKFHKNLPSTTNKPQIYINGFDDTNVTQISYCYSCTTISSISLGFTASWSFGGGTVDTADITTGSSWLNGSLDEFRITDKIPSDDEISFIYDLENNSYSFFTLGSSRFYDFSDPIISQYGIHDPGDGTGYIYAEIADKSPITAYIDVNNSDPIPLVSNGTSNFYIFQLTGIEFNSTFSYKIINATDNLGYYTNGDTTLTNYTFNIDNTKPVITNINYNAYLSYNGTFVAQVSDNWGGVQNVEVHVQCQTSCSGTSYAEMKYNGTYFVNNSLFMVSQSITYYIIAYDVNGNFFNSSLHGGTVLNHAPTISNAYLTSATGNFFSNETINLYYSYSDPDNNPDSSNIYWYRNDTLQSALNNYLVIPVSSIRKGETWYAIIQSNDGQSYNNLGNNIQTNITVTIKNTPPTILYANLKEVTSSTNLFANYSSSDNPYDGDILSENLFWYKNEELMINLNNTKTLDKGNTTKGESWYYIIEITDGTNTTIKISNTIIIQNTLPTITGAITFNYFNVSNPTDNLSVQYTYFDYDGDIQGNPIIYWYLDYEYNSTFTNLTTLRQGIEYQNDSFYYYVIRLYDGEDYGINYTSILNPMGSVVDRYAPIVYDIHFVNENNVTCVSSCTTLDIITLTYTFYDNDTPTNPKEIGSIVMWYRYDGFSFIRQDEYNNTFVIPAGTFKHGEIWKAEIIPSDGLLYGSFNTSINNLTIANILPTITLLVGQISVSGSNITVTSTTTDENLYASWNSFDADNDSLQFEIHWWKGSEDFGNINSTSLSSSFTKKDDIWNISVRLWDGFNWTSYYNYSITIINSIPNVSSLNIFGGENVTQQISISYIFIDADNDDDSSLITWYVNNQPSQIGLVTFNNFKAGDVVKVIIIANDETVTGNNITISVLVGNAIPEITLAYVYHDNNQTTFFANNSLIAFFIVYDPDESSNYGLYSGSDYNASGIGVDYRWYDNGVLTSFTSQTIPSTSLNKDHVWILSVRPYDQQGAIGDWFNATSIIILNSAPLVSSIIWNNYYPTTLTDLVILYTENDFDNDPMQITIVWFINSTEITSNENKTTLSSSLFVKNQFIYVLFNATDGINHSITFSITLRILNSAPTIKSMSINNGQQTYTNQNLTLTWLYYDVDDDPQVNSSVKIKWYRNGELLTSFDDNLIISYLNTTKDDIWYAIVEVYDGEAFSLAYSSSDFLTFVILNSAPIINSITINNNQTILTNQSLSFSYAFLDFDNDAVVPLIYNWYKNGVFHSNLQSLSPSDTARGDNFTLYLIISDGFSSSNLFISNIYVIKNSPPVVTSIVWNNLYPTSQQNLSVTFTQFDNDGDVINSEIHWFVTNTSGTFEIVSNYNESLINHVFYTKGNNVSIEIVLTDGFNQTISYSINVQIRNAPPQITSISVNNYQSTYTNQNLTAFWTYYDPDNDTQTNYSILWYRNGLLMSNFNDLVTIQSINTQKGQNWYVRIIVFDELNESIAYFSLNSFEIQNSEPIASQISINDYNTTYSDNELRLLFKYTDLDDDQHVTSLIIVHWFKNGIYQPSMDNLTTIDSLLTKKGDLFLANFMLFDGSNYSILYTTSTITIQNKAPFATNFIFKFNNPNISPETNRNFYLDYENITISYDFNDTDSDPNFTVLYWYKNGNIVNSFTNKTSVGANYLIGGDEWQVVIILSDGEVVNDPLYSNVIYIVNSPQISSISESIPNISDHHPEGIFIFKVVSNTTNPEIDDVDIIFDQNIQNSTAIKSLISSLPSKLYSMTKTENNIWSSSFIDIFIQNRTVFSTLIGKSITIQIKVFFTIIDPNSSDSFSIWKYYYYTLVIKDLSPPIVRNAIVTFDNPDNPNNVTFTVQIEDFGSGIENVTVFYYFKSTSGTLSSESTQSFKIYADSKLPDGYLTTQLFLTGNNIYSNTVPFKSNSSVTVIYQIMVFDKNGNFNNDAYPEGIDSTLTFIYQDPGLSITLVAFIVILVLVVGSIFTFIGIKKFRSTEIIGLDIEKVMDESKNIKNSEVLSNLNTHTLGILISVFHQTHGPLPLLALPSILTDNLEKLVDLSDRSFSAVRFVDDFNTEMQITFDYSISTSIKIASISYGFSLNRPEMRGGADNITLNIMMHKPYDLVINQFIGKLDPLVHEIHTIMDKDEDNKDLIEKKLENLRNHISRIILAYHRVYQDEVIEEFLDS